jgi:tetratricopeptide (TPR) repeat protein/predicted Ser/Thr protein kinase/TolB-like protein
MTTLIGRTVSHYRILAQVGQGGMGTVYKAEDTRLHRTVALKFLNPEMLLDDREKSRFTHEAEAAAQLVHPNIATVYDFEERFDPGTETRQAFIAMEYIDGQPLKRLLDRGPLPFDDAASIARQLAAALQAAHQKGIIHRDVKPSNIIVRNDGSVKVLDFGVARLAGETRVTSTGQVVGSIAYMPPEQLQGEEIDCRSDIWSFGVVLFEMLTQQFPFRGQHAAAVIYSILNEDPPQLETLRKGIPSPLATLCTACLRKNAAERPASMGDVLSMLAGITAPAPGGHRAATHTPSSRRAVAASLGVVALVALLALTVPDIRTRITRIFALRTGPQRILAVIPFTPIDTSGDSRSFCAGLSWMVPSRLAELMKDEASIALVGSGDISKYGVTTFTEARKVLGASLVVTGGMQRIGDVVRLTVDLYDAASNRHMDSRNSTYAAGRYSAMEDDAIRQVLTMLGINVPEPPQTPDRRGTADDEAYQFYAQGRGYLLQYQKRENLSIAADLFRKAIQRDSLFAGAHAGLGEALWLLYTATNDTLWMTKAAQEAAKAIHLNPALPEAQITMGMIQSGRGHYEQASGDFENAIALDPKNTRALRGLADAYNRLGRYGEAESTLTHAISLNPTYWAEYNSLGFLYYTRGRYQDAAAQFRKVTELTPDNGDGFNNLGAMEIFSQRWKEAREALAQAVKLSPSSYSLSNLGSVYFYLKDYKAAAGTYSQALSVDSNDYRIWGSMAASQYWAPGEREKSFGSYRRAAHLAEIKREVDPRDAEVLSHLANFYGFLGERRKALSILEQSLRGSRNAPELLERGAETYNVLGERPKALECLRRALQAGTDPGLVQLNPALQELVSDDLVRGLLKGPGVEPH